MDQINVTPLNFDLVIIGGGAIGMSTAFWIKKKIPGTKVLVIEKDLKVNSK